jgi:hypothetical protein
MRRSLQREGQDERQIISPRRHGENIQKIINEAPSQPDEAKPEALNREGAKDARKARFESGLNQK